MRLSRKDYEDLLCYGFDGGPDNHTKLLDHDEAQRKELKAVVMANNALQHELAKENEELGADLNTCCLERDTYKAALEKITTQGWLESEEMFDIAKEALEKHEQ